MPKPRPRKVNPNHSAAGPMAGYLFQPERALHHLAISPRGALVGIETLDDVAVVFPDGRQIREQDKHYISEGRALPDRSKDLWGTLKNWLDAWDAEEIHLESTELHVVTNRRLRKGLAFDLKKLPNSDEARSAFVARLREAGKNPPKGLEATVSSVLTHTTEQLTQLIYRVRVFDSGSATSGKDLRQALYDQLHLPAAHADEIIQGLLGWIDEIVLERIRQGNPAWISRDAFSEQYRRLLFRYQDVLFLRETAEALITVTEQQRLERRNRLFVKQLTWVGIGENDEVILDAIDAHIRSGSEVIRLSKLGIVSPPEFRAFDDRLVSRWKMLYRLHVRNSLSGSESQLQELGRVLLDQALNHREPLAGLPTTEYYLTHGAYHHLADDKRVGWHPLYEEKAKERKVSEGDSHATGNGS